MAAAASVSSDEDANKAKSAVELARLKAAEALAAADALAAGGSAKAPVSLPEASSGEYKRKSVKEIKADEKMRAAKKQKLNAMQKRRDDDDAIVNWVDADADGDAQRPITDFMPVGSKRAREPAAAAFETVQYGTDSAMAAWLAKIDAPWSAPAPVPAPATSAQEPAFSAPEPAFTSARLAARGARTAYRHLPACSLCCLACRVLPFSTSSRMGYGTSSPHTPTVRSRRGDSRRVASTTTFSKW